VRHIRVAAISLLCAAACAFAGASAIAQPARGPSARAASASARVAHARSRHRRRACARRASYRAHSRPHRCAARKHHRRHHKKHRSAHRAPARHTGPSAADLAQCPGATLTPDAGNVTLVREAAVCLVNRERADHGEQPLVRDGALDYAAQAHSESMWANSYFEHDGPGGSSPLSRMRAAGYIGGAQSFEVGENIGWGTLWLGSPRAIVAAWMASPGHRANILDARFRETGMGVSPHVPRSWGHGQAGGIYTQDFGVRG
jgi:uncharacterized protein YkwD